MTKKLKRSAIRFYGREKLEREINKYENKGSTTGELLWLSYLYGEAKRRGLSIIEHRETRLEVKK